MAHGGQKSALQTIGGRFPLERPAQLFALIAGGCADQQDTLPNRCRMGAKILPRRSRLKNKLRARILHQVTKARRPDEQVAQLGIVGERAKLWARRQEVQVRVDKNISQIQCFDVSFP